MSDRTAEEVMAEIGIATESRTSRRLEGVLIICPVDYDTPVVFDPLNFKRGMDVVPKTDGSFEELPVTFLV